jgi:hypothetical protein
MTPRERELLRAMGNCYNVCHEDFKSTVHMVASGRGLSDEEVIAALRSAREKYGETEEYRNLRSRFPEDFPV